MRSPASASFSLSWMMSVPSARIASRNEGRSPRSRRAPVTTYRRAAARRFRPTPPSGALPTGHGPDQLQPVAVREQHGFIPAPLERLAVPFHHDEPRIERPQPDEPGHGQPLLHVERLAVGEDPHPAAASYDERGAVSIASVAGSTT